MRETASRLRVPIAAESLRVFLHVVGAGASPAAAWGHGAFRLFSCDWADAPAGARLAAAVRATTTGLGLWARHALRSLGRMARRRPERVRDRKLRLPADAAGDTGPPLPRLHTNACGDFTLMAREHWDELAGYPELEMYSLHIDSLLLYAAHGAGLEEIVLPASMRAYHIEHSAGSGWTPEGENRLFERLRSQGIPVLTTDDLHAMARRLAAQGDPRLFGSPGWGFAAEQLPETRLGKPGRALAA